MDSGLEAFSLYPTGLASRHCLIMQPYKPNARKIGSSRTLIFYSLYNNFDSGVKLTCLTTV